ncbi:membrane-associated guanylate kinase, WW and PDZ domain-containing protein 1 [Anopheles nili]|uniref:membrane-associated guanylate kinase, WW and PDZ domain-containing protein 1 n=1 Tax=Anopheles nili TaxID=185578 RepID=UPI00237BEE66|nr:membrane-associated guanylate kinase, WW and PDZ domain-containing protein 1 [Anopheles nili]
MSESVATDSTMGVQSDSGQDASQGGGGSDNHGAQNGTGSGQSSTEHHGPPPPGVPPGGSAGNNGNLALHHNSQHLHQHHHHHHHHHHLQQQQQGNDGSVSIATGDSETGSFYDQKTDVSSHQLDDEDGLGPLPPKWEKAYTDSGEVYFIDHNTGTSHWLDPRLSKFQKKSLEDCQDDELPYGWEKICDPHYGTYYIDHVNRKTQYENPVLQAKRMQERSGSSVDGPNPLDGGGASGGGPLGGGGGPLGGGGGGRVNHFTKNPANLRGERLMTTLVKSIRGLGFTIVGGDDNVEEFLQIKSIVPNGPAWMDGQLKMGDVLVYVNDICVLGFTHHEMVNIFQSIMAGEEVHLDVCRGYPLPFDPNDPNTEVVTTIAVDGLVPNGGAVIADSELKFLENGGFMVDHSSGGSSDVLHKNPLAKIQSSGSGPTITSNGGDVYFNDTLSYQQHYNKGKAFDMPPEILHINIVKSDNGFGFTITDSSYGQRVKKILDRQCCKNLQEGDVLLSINSIPVKDMSHNEVVQVLKDCPKNIETTLKVQRGPAPAGGGMMVGPGAPSSASGSLPASSKLTNKLRKSIEMAKFGSGGGGMLKKDGPGVGSNLFRSKTPTADLYSTQAKEILPTRPKTPLVDTRARAKTPSLPLAELNADEIELDGAGGKSVTDSKLELNMKSNGSAHDNDSIANDIALYGHHHPGDDQFHHHHHHHLAHLGHLKHPTLSERLGELTIGGSSNNSTSDTAIYHNHGQQGVGGHSYAGGGGGFHPTNSMGGPGRASAGSNAGGGYNQLYSPPLVPPPPVPPLGQGQGYHHDNCFCYDCQDYRQQQQQQQHLMNRQFPSQPMHHMNPSPHGTYSLPPQMSDNIGKRLNDYLMDRKRSMQQSGNPGPPIGGVPQYDNLYLPHNLQQQQQQQQQHQQMAPHPMHHLQQSPGGGNGMSLYDTQQQQQLSHFYGHPAQMHPAGNGWKMAPGQQQQQQQQQHSPSLQAQQHNNIYGAGFPGGGNGFAGHGLDEYSLTEVTLERQALGFGFRIVGGTEEGSQVTVGHIVPGGAADKDTRIATGDEILNINGVNVENASHHRVVQLMGEAGLRGQVTMILRRRQLTKPMVPPPPPPPFPANPRYPYNVLVTRKENEGFGFVIISSSGQFLGSSIGDLIPGSPAERCGELKIGDRIIAVNSIDITGMSHSDVVNLIKESGLQVKLTIDSPRDGIMHPAIGSLIQPSVPTSAPPHGGVMNGGGVGGGGGGPMLSSNTDLYVSSNSTASGSNGPTINRYPAIIS